MAHIEKDSDIDRDNDFADWMSQLPDFCHDLPLNGLAIPGSHDSFSAQLRDGHISPDNPEILNIIVKFLGAAADKVMMKWSTTQNFDLSKQLKAGIRYFDFRVAYNETDDELQFVHGLFGPKIECCMNEINSFLDEHPKEVVILDFNHFYNVNFENHEKLLSMLHNIFGKKMCPHIGASNLTLSIAWEDNLQVVICYNHDVATKNQLFWPAVKHFWANTDNLSKLMDELEKLNRKGRCCECFFNWQGILTPTFNTILQHLDGSLKTVLSEKATAAVNNWVCDKSPSSKGLNIISVDFIELDNFVQTVIRMNHNIK
ncbi:PI-PLC X domain-containing protein 3-like [Argonauta hians]